MTELNLGADWEQSKRLVKHWSDMYFKAKLKVDWYEADEKVRYVCRMYSDLSAEDKVKIDTLMKALKGIHE